jgi:hypothetical protein
MNTKIKFAAALAALAFAATLALPGEAQAHRRGWGWGIGPVAPGLFVPVYAQPVYIVPIYRTCKRIPQFDFWGNYVGTARVCRHVE